MEEQELVSVYERTLILGAELMRQAVWNGLAPILKSQGFGDYALSQIFKDSDLLYEVTPDNMTTIIEHAQKEYHDQRKSELGVN